MRNIYILLAWIVPNNPLIKCKEPWAAKTYSDYWLATRYNTDP